MVAGAQTLSKAACQACTTRTPALLTQNWQQVRPFTGSKKMGAFYSRMLRPIITASAATTSAQSRADPRNKHFWQKSEVPPLDGKV